MVNNYFLNCNFDDLGIVSEGCGSCLRSQSVRGGEGGWVGVGVGGKRQNSRTSTWDNSTQ